eukprot:757774-Prorocentrum_minimum.AAC.8
MAFGDVVNNLEALKAAYHKQDTSKATTLLGNLQVGMAPELLCVPGFACWDSQTSPLLYRRAMLPDSQQEYPIIGLNLLRLLVQNRTAEFHTELELLSPEWPCLGTDNPVFVGCRSVSGRNIRKQLRENPIDMENCTQRHPGFVECEGNSEPTEIGPLTDPGWMFGRGQTSLRHEWVSRRVHCDSLRVFNYHVCVVNSPLRSRSLALASRSLVSHHRNPKLGYDPECCGGHRRQVQHNVYIKHAIELEQFLMEGAYNKVIAARKDIPAASYEYFMDLLMLTCRWVPKRFDM